MLQSSIIIIVVSLFILFLPQSFWNKILKIAELLTGNYIIAKLWNPIIKSRRRRVTTSILMLFLGLILLILSIS